VVSSRNGRGSNGTSGKVSKNGTFSILGYRVRLVVWKKLTSVCPLYFIIT